MSFKEKVLSVLAAFSPISLEEMDDVKLLDRRDSKYVFHEKYLPALLEKAKEDYRVLQVGNVRQCRYETLYYDDSNFMLYHQHLHKKLNRVKVRARTYADSNLNFFEIKFKNNKGRTIKDRIKIRKIETKLDPACAIFLKEKTGLDSGMLEGKIWINYSRTTLVSTRLKERVTIDTDLTFVAGDHKVKLDNLVIVEIKQDKASTTGLAGKMRELHIPEGSMSKYCIGITQIYQNLKKNNFKPKLLFLKKISNAVKI